MSKKKTYAICLGEVKIDEFRSNDLVFLFIEFQTQNEFNEYEWMIDKFH